jgi:transposase
MLLCRRRSPIEFRREVVAVARKGEAPLSQIAKDFGISESCLHRWLKLADIDDGVRPGVTSSESAELRELKKRNKTLEQENEILRPAAAYFAREISQCGLLEGVPCLPISATAGQVRSRDLPEGRQKRPLTGSGRRGQ